MERQPIEITQERDKRKFLKRNLAVAKRAEYKQEDQRIEQGFVHRPRSAFIEKAYHLSAVLRVLE